MAWVCRRHDGLWSECHVAALPSHGGEGVPMALLMAASMGRALLASDTNGNRDIVLPGRNGFLCLPRDVESLRFAVLQCLEADLRIALGKESRQIVLEREMDEVTVRRAFAKLYN